MRDKQIRTNMVVGYKRDNYNTYIHLYKENQIYTYYMPDRFIPLLANLSRNALHQVRFVLDDILLDKIIGMQYKPHLK